MNIYTQSVGHHHQSLFRSLTPKTLSQSAQTQVTYPASRSLSFRSFDLKIDSLKVIKATQTDVKVDPQNSDLELKVLRSSQRVVDSQSIEDKAIQTGISTENVEVSIQTSKTSFEKPLSTIKDASIQTTEPDVSPEKPWPMYISHATPASKQAVSDHTQMEDEEKRKKEELLAKLRAIDGVKNPPESHPIHPTALRGSTGAGQEGKIFSTENYPTPPAVGRGSIQASTSQDGKNFKLDHDSQSTQSTQSEVRRGPLQANSSKDGVNLQRESDIFSSTTSGKGSIQTSSSKDGGVNFRDRDVIPSESRKDLVQPRRDSQRDYNYSNQPGHGHVFGNSSIQTTGMTSQASPEKPVESRPFQPAAAPATVSQGSTEMAGKFQSGISRNLDQTVGSLSNSKASHQDQFIQSGVMNTPSVVSQNQSNQSQPFSSGAKQRSNQARGTSLSGAGSVFSGSQNPSKRSSLFGGGELTKGVSNLSSTRRSTVDSDWEMQVNKRKLLSNLMVSDGEAKAAAMKKSKESISKSTLSGESSNASLQSWPDTVQNLHSGKPAYSTESDPFGNKNAAFIAKKTSKTSDSIPREHKPLHGRRAGNSSSISGRLKESPFGDLERGIKVSAQKLDLRPRIDSYPWEIEIDVRDRQEPKFEDGRPRQGRETTISKEALLPLRPKRNGIAGPISDPDDLEEVIL